MSYSVQSINCESSGLKTQRAQQEQILQMQQLKEAKTQEDGTKVEDSSAVTSVESKTDSIEISAEGQLALEQMKAAKAGAEPIISTAQTDDTGTTTSTSDTVSVSTKTSTTDSSVSELLEDDENISTTDLYTMSESDLRSLVSEGKITRKEMEDELSRRNEST